MEKCSYCKKLIREIPFKCKSCKKVYCSKHRIPEDHKCIGLPTFEENKSKWQKAVKQGLLRKENYEDNFDLDNEGISLNYLSNKRKKMKAQSLIWFFVWIAVTIFLIWAAFSLGIIVIIIPLPIYLAFKSLEEFFKEY